MTTKYTPGPWEVEGIGQVIVPARPPAWRTLADVYGEHGDEEQADADAHLIAAAPDLLAACEAAKAQLDISRPYDPKRRLIEVLPAWGMLCAAIAKAKGETT